MKRVLIVAALLALAVVASPAGAMNWSGTVLQLQPIFDGGSFQPVIMGWYTDQGNGTPSTDGYDRWSDYGMDLPSLDGQMRFDLGPVPGMPAELGTTNMDFRAPDGLEKRWIVTAQIQTNTDHLGGQFGIAAWCNPGYGMGSQPFYIFQGTVSLASCRAYAAANTNYVVKLTGSNLPWNSSPTQWAMPAPTSFTSWDPDANDGEGTEVTAWTANPTMHFTVYTPTVPEPASILGLFAGLAGLAGFGLRRKR